jgi:hypothetical protein
VKLGFPRYGACFEGNKIRIFKKDNEMKKKIKVGLMIICLLMSLSLLANDPPLPPPPPPGGGNPSGPPLGGGAPIGGGLFILLGLGGVYGLYRYYQQKKKSLLD